MASKLRYIFFILGGLAIAIFLSLGIDRFLGLYLNKSGYFYALPRNLTIKYNTSEFTATATISAQGLRNPPVTLPKPPRTIRFLALGDSFTYGWGVDLDQTWVKLLEKNLNTKGHQIEIINAGLPGAGITQERYVCRAYADQFQIDGFILGVFSDDLYQAASREQSLTPLTNFVQNTWPIFSRINHPQIGDSTDFEYPTTTTNKTWKTMANINLKRNPKILINISPTLRPLYVEGKVNPAYAVSAITDPNFLTYSLDQNRLDYALKAFDDRLQLLKQRCTKNLPVTIIFIPRSSSVSTTYHPYFNEWGYQTDPDLVTKNTDAYLKPIVTSHGFTYLSVLTDFRTDGCLNCYYKYDQHLTDIGNIRVSDFLASNSARLLSF